MPLLVLNSTAINVCTMLLQTRVPQQHMVEPDDSVAYTGKVTSQAMLSCERASFAGQIKVLNASRLF